MKLLSYLGYIPKKDNSSKESLLTRKLTVIPSPEGKARIIAIFDY